MDFPKVARKFELFETEQAAARKWLKQHECKYTELDRLQAESWARGDGPTIAVNSYSYCFTPSSAFTFIKIRCECGKSQDISDYSTF